MMRMNHRTAIATVATNGTTRYLLLAAIFSCRNLFGIFSPSVYSRNAEEVLEPSSTSSSLAWPKPHLTVNETAILVLSARSHVEARQTIRETWGRGHDNVYFIIGQHCLFHKSRRKDEYLCKPIPSIEADTHDEWYQKRMTLESDLLREEQAHYRDMLWTPEPESYRGLPYKLKEGYAWVTSQLPKAKWIVKVDDDTFVRVSSLAKYLTNPAWNSTHPTILGKISYHGVVLTSGKWKEEHYKGHDNTYPPFPIGSCGHVVSRPVAEYVAKHKDKLFEYQGEDTSLGIWMDEAPLKVEWLHRKSFQNNKRCQDPNLLVIGHDLSTDRIRECFNSNGGASSMAKASMLRKGGRGGLARKEDQIRLNQRLKHSNGLWTSFNTEWISSMPKASALRFEPTNDSSIEEPLFYANISNTRFAYRMSSQLFSNATTSANRMTLIFGILSLSSNYRRRQVIRDTWAPGQNVAFIVAGNWSTALEEESRRCGDILWLAAHEEYYDPNAFHSSLSFKTQIFLHTLQQHAASFDYAFKADDDSYVRVPELVTALEKTKADYWGRCFHEAKPYRNHGSKWYVSEAQFRGRMYPPYCTGGGYALSKEFVHCAAEHLPMANNFPFEDVAMGFLAQLCHAKVISGDGVITEDYGRRKGEFQGKYVVANPVSAEGMIRLQEEENK